MQKLPKYVLIIIFILICGLLFSIICLIRSLFREKIELTENQFYIIFFIIAVTSFLAGIAFTRPQKSWTLDNFIDKINNVLIINTALINLQQKKLEIIERDPVLSKLPDNVEVIITRHKIGKEK